MVDVVVVGPRHGGVTARKDAAAVASGHASALGGAGQPDVVAEVQGHAEAVDDDGVEVGVAAQGAGGAVL
jgi:hypothetical protein